MGNGCSMADVRHFLLFHGGCRGGQNGTDMLHGMECSGYDKMTTILDSDQIDRILEAEEIESASPQDAEWAALKRYADREFDLLLAIIGDDVMFGPCARFLRRMVDKAEACDGYAESDN